MLVSTPMKTALCLAAACVAAFAAAPAAAVTAEEAVAYALMGLADGATLARGRTTLAWKETAASPAVFEGDGRGPGQNYHVRFTVAALDPCIYEITVEGPPGMIRMGKALFARVDLRKVTGIAIAADALHTTVSGDGLCETGNRNPVCMPVGSLDLFGTVEPEKHRQAVAFLSETVCPAGKWRSRR